MIFPYSQCLDPRWSASGPVDQASANMASGTAALQGKGAAVFGTVTSNGACQGISAWWVILRSLGEDFWTWFGPPESAAPKGGASNGKAGEPVRVIKDVMKGQSTLAGVYEKFHQSQGIVNPLAALSLTRSKNIDAMGNYIVAKSNGGLVKRTAAATGQNVSWETLASSASSAPGYFYISFFKYGWGGHSVAVHVFADGSLEFMDPNIGELEGPNSAALIHYFSNHLGSKCYNLVALDFAEVQHLQRP